jgi:hypothetical protein
MRLAYTLSISALIAFGVMPAYTQEALSQDVLPPADTLLARSIAYHDPGGLFMSRVHRLSLREMRPGAPDRRTIITFDGPGTELVLEQQRDGRLIEAAVDPSGCSASLDGSTAIPDSLVSRYRLSCEGLRWVRDYYAFLFALPMKLAAPGTRLAPEATRSTFQGEPFHELRVTFDAEVGTDTWLVYLDPATHTLLGYRFYHDEAADDGEYIILDGEVSASGIRLPRERRWHVNADDRFLGRRHHSAVRGSRAVRRLTDNRTGRPVHVVAADNERDEETIVVTVYKPDPARWSDTFRTRSSQNDE